MKSVYAGAKQSYRLVIDAELYQYIMTLARESAPNEILGMGMISKQCSRSTRLTQFVLEEVFVPVQKVGPDDCVFEEGAQNEIIYEVIERGDSPVGLCFRWHSHADHPVYFSPIDENDIDDCDSPYVVNLVVNANRDMLARLDILEPVRVRNIPLEIIIEPTRDGELMAECKDEIKKYCKPFPERSTLRQLKPGWASGHSPFPDDNKKKDDGLRGESGTTEEQV